MFSEQLGCGGHLPPLSVTEAVPSLISFDPPSNLCDKNYDNLPNFTAETLRLREVTILVSHHLSRE